MSHPLSLRDFRARRIVLDPDDFALSDGRPDPPPTDLVPKQIWNGMMTLPSDVSIRTSDHFGRVLTSQYNLWSLWIEAGMAIVDKPTDLVLGAMRDATDEIAACTFDMLHGYHRQAVASLRSFLELMLEGAAAGVSGTAAPASTFSFKREADRIRVSGRLQRLDTKLESHSAQRLFGASPAPAGGAWIGDLYGRLSEYAHARPGRTALGDIWRSNGPIYVPRAIHAVHLMFVETFRAGCILACLGLPSLRLPPATREALRNSGVRASKTASKSLQLLKAFG